MKRVLLLVLLALPLAFAARPVLAVPAIGEPYVGLGARSYGLPGSDGVGYAGTLEGGVDAILLSNYGAGLRVDFPAWKPSAVVQFRYSILKVPFIRLFAGLGGGFEQVRTGANNSLKWNGIYELFVGARVSLGVPYLGVDVGGANSAYKTDGFDLFSKITLGVSL